MESLWWPVYFLTPRTDSVSESFGVDRRLKSTTYDQNGPGVRRSQYNLTELTSELWKPNVKLISATLKEREEKLNQVRELAQE